MRRILIHSLIFSPDGVSTAYLYNDIALAFKRKGYDVLVVSTTPHFNVISEAIEKQPMQWKLLGLYKVSDFKGIKVYHVPQKKFKNTILRLLGFLYWHVVSFFLILSIKNVDVILSPSPPLTIGWLNLLLGRLKHSKVVYNVQEIFPDILFKNKTGLVYKTMSRIEHKIYNYSDAVTTIDQVFYDIIVPRFRDKTKLHIIPNFVDTDLYRPNAGHLDLDSQLFPENNNIKVLYAGNIGFAQDWEPLIELAKKTKDAAIEYYVIGEGVRKGFLEERKEHFKLDNLHILPYQQRELMPQILDYSDIQFIFMNPEMDMQGFPSKVYTVMACGKPLLICSGDGTPIVNFLKNVGCAKLVTSHALEKKVPQMVEWLKAITREELKEMGEKGAWEIKSKYTKDIVTKQYVNLVEGLIEPFSESN